MSLQVIHDGHVIFDRDVDTLECKDKAGGTFDLHATFPLVDMVGPREGLPDISGALIRTISNLGSPDEHGRRAIAAAADERIPGIRASIEVVHRFCESHGATDVGRELFHIHKEMEHWLQEIEEGDA